MTVWTAIVTSQVFAITLRILLSIGLGALIGLERQLGPCRRPERQGGQRDLLHEYSDQRRRAFPLASHAADHSRRADS